MKLGHTIEDSRAKYPELTDDIINELRSWADEHGIPGIPDAQLGIFAHSCYYDVEATKRCMSVYYRMRSDTPEFFGNRDPTIDSMQQCLKIQYVNKERTFLIGSLGKTVNGQKRMRTWWYFCLSILLFFLGRKVDIFVYQRSFRIYLHSTLSLILIFLMVGPNDGF